jgi:hypothetical protein
LPIAVQALAATETPGPIEASELLRFFEQFLSEHGLSIEAKRIRQLADTVAGKMEGAGTARLRVMGREVPEACRELLSRQQG